jgi:hypothetical protein
MSAGHDEAVLKAVQALEDARKKLMVQGKTGNGREAAYAEAYKALCRLDPIRYRPNKGKYR